MKISKAAVLLLGLLITALSTIGCGGATEPVANGADADRMKVLGILYGSFIRQSGGRVPASQKQFVSFLEKQPENWEKLVPSAEKLLNSPRDEKPFVVLYGKDLNQAKPGSAIWFAYEREATDGKRHVINARGQVELMDENELKQIFP